ncbi:uncharacterized protein LOC113240454 isoform X2 [Hyposmocoma kahamanoa]|uniref:uncharacterized protein LOC113240454 isoform X2 n=1 Tax=Hyposmocoma kahamanoa TaxID=1477025 RepID=UPI000E6DA12B|nr:uncharacterized protein LOC113240454 isoform X2 [Hyposmocoma kahamanoa]
MWSRKLSVSSGVSGASKCDDADIPLASGLQLYPFAIALRVRVLQIVCGIGGLVVGAVGWLEERQKPALGLGVPAGAVTVLAAATSVYYSRGFGGWVSARSKSTIRWGAPWRALGPSPCAAVPLTILWTAAVTAHIVMFTFCMRFLTNIETSSTTCIGVAGAQLSVSITTLAAQVFMLQLDLRYDAALSPPPRQSDTQTNTAVSMSSWETSYPSRGRTSEAGKLV